MQVQPQTMSFNGTDNTLVPTSINPVEFTSGDTDLLLIARPRLRLIPTLNQKTGLDKVRIVGEVPISRTDTLGNITVAGMAKIDATIFLPRIMTMTERGNMYTSINSIMSSNLISALIDLPQNLF